MYVPKRLVIHPSAAGGSYTSVVIQRIKSLNPEVSIERPQSKKYLPPPNSDPYKQLKYLKETLLLRERSGPFLTTFASPGDIVEEMCTIASLGWHCCCDCEYCYLQASTQNNQWQLFYTNIDKLDQELEIEPFVHRILLTILTAKSYIDQIPLMKIPIGFHGLANGIRGKLQKRKSNRVKDDKTAFQYLSDNISHCMDAVNSSSTYCIQYAAKEKANETVKRWRKKEDPSLVTPINDLLCFKDIIKDSDYKMDFEILTAKLESLIHKTADKGVSRGYQKILVILSREVHDYTQSQIDYVKHNLKDYYLLNSGYKPRLNISEYSDAVAIQHISKNLSPVMKILQKHPGIEMVLPTKSTNLDELLEHDGMGRAIVTMNFNTEHFIKTFEHGTASLEDRIEAAQKIQTAKGFRLNVSIEPMFFYRDYLADYKKLVKQILQSLNPDKVETVILGTARFGQVLKGILVDIHPKTEVFQKNLPLHPIKGVDVKWRNEDSVRKKTYRAIMTEFSKYGDFQFFLGAETPEMWESLGLDVRAHLDKFFYQYTN